jgi:hypothetical protein
MMRVRVVHGAVVFGLLAIFVVILWLRSQAEGAAAAMNAPVLRPVGYALVVAGIFVTRVVRSRMAPQRGSGLAEWWSANLPLAVSLWALAEGAGLGGVILGWLAGDLTLVTVAALVSLALLFVYRPGALAGGE